MHFESMEENPCEIQRRGGASGHAKRYPAADDEEEEFGGSIECSGKSCGSCTAGLIADCVAVCCCPCAVVNILALAFLKVPWMMGRKCLGLGKKNKKKKKMRKCCANARSRIKEIEAHHEWEIRMDMDGITGKEQGEEGTVSGIGQGEELDEEEEEDEGETDTAYSARFEAEKVWLELYQVGHLGFGRVSFTGIQSMAKGN